MPSWRGIAKGVSVRGSYGAGYRIGPVSHFGIPEFSEQYARAPHHRGGGDTVDRSRLMMDARKWLASKLAPKKYGDKIAGEALGSRRWPDPGAPDWQSR
jgi:hypothetical protein